MADMAESYEQEYMNRFESRRTRQITNLKELSEVAHSGGGDSIKAFPGLRSSLASDDPKDALRWSIILLWCEATECYILGEFQSCILTCGAIVERCLKLEYQQGRGPLPAKAKWTLGKCIAQCQGIVDARVLKLAEQILPPRNDRAHALLEHSDPQTGISGGDQRGIEILGSGNYLIEPYRGEAKSVVMATFNVLRYLYGRT
jgi:hypothetical protein